MIADAVKAAFDIHIERLGKEYGVDRAAMVAAAILALASQITIELVNLQDCLYHCHNKE